MLLAFSRRARQRSRAASAAALAAASALAAVGQTAPAKVQAAGEGVQASQDVDVLAQPYNGMLLIATIPGNSSSFYTAGASAIALTCRSLADAAA